MADTCFKKGGSRLCKVFDLIDFALSFTKKLNFKEKVGALSTYATGAAGKVGNTLLCPS